MSAAGGRRRTGAGAGSAAPAAASPGGEPYVSQADLGGLDGFGPVAPDPDEPLFHAGWEARVLALTLAMGATGAWNLDMSRSARETLPGYRRLGYYAIWLAALERLMAERGLVGADEIEAGRMLHAALPVPRVLQAAQVQAALSRGSPTVRPAPGAARFAVGDAVRTRATLPPGHTRLPGYARGRRGRVERIHGAHVFADAHARGEGEQPRWLYTVSFDAAELWGAAAQPGRVSIDAWEPYLEPDHG